MKILSLNVAGMNNAGKQAGILSLCRSYNVSMLQETKLKRHSLPVIQAKWGLNKGQVFMAGLPTARRGVITIFHRHCEAVHVYHKEDVLGQFLINIAVIKGNSYLFANVYGDPDTDVDCTLTFHRLSVCIENISLVYQFDHIIMAGDFNCALNGSDYRTLTRSKPSAEARLSTLVNDFQLFDIEELCRDQPRFTYFRTNMESTCARYDRFYTSLDMSQGSSVVYLNDKRDGDHMPIVLLTEERPPNAPSWSFTDILLKSDQFCIELKSVIKEVLASFIEDDVTDFPFETVQYQLDFSQVSSNEVLDLLISKLVTFCKNATAVRRQEMKDKESEALRELVEARDAFNNTPTPSPEVLTRYETAKANLRSNQELRAERLADRHLTNYALHGERMSQYHFSRVRPGRAGREIKKLFVNGRLLCDLDHREEIVEHMAKKFEDLSCRDPNAAQVSIQEFLGPQLSDSIPKWTEEQQSELKAAVTEDELYSIVKDLKNFSAPGPLGISNRLLRFIFPMTSYILVDIANRFMDPDWSRLPSAWFYHRKVVFIPKPGKDPQSEDSYRGLSMLENIFKLFSKCYGDRLGRVLRTIQTSHQFGFTAGRSAQEASRCVSDAIAAARQSGVPLIAISTDVYKAFDQVSHEYMRHCLDFHGAPPEFILAFMRLMCNGTVSYEINGQTSRTVNVENGTGQGDPKSSYAFNLAVNPKNYLLEFGADIPRLELFGTPIPTSSFADDDLILLNGTDAQAIVRAINKINSFYHVSGLRLNLSKCELMSINCDPTVVLDVLNQTGMKHVIQFKHLGVFIDNRGRATYEDNIRPLEASLRGLINSFSTSQSTPLGRSLYAKFLLASKYVHRLQCCVFEDEEATELKRLVVSATWTRVRWGEQEASRRTHIASARVNQKIKFGGLAVSDPHIQNISIRFFWARRFIEHESHNTTTWKIILEGILAEHGRPSIGLHLLLGPHEWTITSEQIQESSPYWAHVFSSMAEIMSKYMVNDKLWHIVPIVGSEDSTFNNTISSLSFSNPAARPLIDNGLHFIGQLFPVNAAGFILPARMHSLGTLNRNFNNAVTPFIYNTIVGAVNSIKQSHRIAILQTPVRCERISPLERLASRFRTGCSAATQVLLKDLRLKWPWGPFPRSSMTYARDGLTNLSPANFVRAFECVRRTCLLPSIQWTSFQILTRTLWTNLKEASTTRGQENGVDGHCANCLEDPEHTLHLMYECPVASQLIEHVYGAINRVLPPLVGNEGLPLVKSLDQVIFFHLPSELHADIRRDIHDIFMIVKHSIYRLRLREDQLNIPTLFDVMLPVTLELGKLARCRFANSMDFLIIERIQRELETVIGINH